MAREQLGQTLQATALVHLANLRLVSHDPQRGWNDRGHCFAAAAEAMRRIPVVPRLLSCSFLRGFPIVLDSPRVGPENQR
jgi:hypothetical protein